MAQKVTGIVSEITGRETRVGTMYDVVVNGKKYGAGKYPPRGIQKGDFVTFDVEVKQNGEYTNYNIVAKSIRKDDAPTSDQVESAKAETRVNVSADNKRQETISKQANLNSAIALVGLQLQHGALKLPTKAADAYSLIQTAVLDTATKLFKQTTGDDWTLLEDKPAAKAKAEPETQDEYEDKIPF